MEVQFGYNNLINNWQSRIGIFFIGTPVSFTTRTEHQDISWNIIEIDVNISIDIKAVNRRTD